MSSLKKLGIVSAFLLQQSSAAALPTSDLLPREEVYRDVIRYMKCANLFTSKPDVGGWEQGMAAYWPDEATGGEPPERVIFDMYSAMEDYFYNGRGIKYGGTSDQGTSIWVDFKDPGVIKPPNKIYVGHVERKTATQTFGYNCFTEDEFEYEDPKYGTCMNYVKCVQKDAVKVFIKGSEDVMRATDMPNPSEIYAKIDEVYDKKQRLCDSKKEVDLDYIKSGCKIKFDCEDNDEEGAIMDMLVQTMRTMGSSSEFWKDEVVKGPIVCDPSTDVCKTDNEYIYRSIPSQIQLVARGIPQTTGRVGYKVAHVKATITCKNPNKDALCNALAKSFGLVSFIPKVADIGDVAGWATEVGCGIVSEDDDDED
jgi:hypothetical protein